MIRLALYQPDIPQNTGAAMRLCACLGMGLDIIEPCGFLLNDKKIKRSAMDYIGEANIIRHSSWGKFLEAYKKSTRRIILMTTKTECSYTDFAFEKDDILLAGSESTGVPDEVYNAVNGRITIRMQEGLRSLNVINASAMIAGEALRQVG